MEKSGGCGLKGIKVTLGMATGLGQNSFMPGCWEAGPDHPTPALERKQAEGTHLCPSLKRVLHWGNPETHTTVLPGISLLQGHV